jgi:hypothetical protein
MGLATMGPSLSTLAIRVIGSLAPGHFKRRDTKKILDLGPLDLRPIGEIPTEWTATSASGGKLLSRLDVKLVFNLAEGG